MNPFETKPESIGFYCLVENPRHLEALRKAAANKHMTVPEYLSYVITDMASRNRLPV